MSEYIDKQKLMHNFCGYDLTKCVKYGNQTNDQERESYSTLMMYEIADVIDSAPTFDSASAFHKWTSVEDCIPDIDEKVLAYCSNTDKYFVASADMNTYTGKPEWTHYGARGARYSATSKVTHWMPLPAPPNDDEKG